MGKEKVGRMAPRGKENAMASYRGHLAFAAALGAAYGGVAAWQFQLDWGPVLLGAGLTTVSGLLPDLDSDSSVPVRELFGLAAALTPFLLFRRLATLDFSMEEVLVILAVVYLLIRYPLAIVFKKMTVHRGMFHSLPAMLIAGLSVFLVYHSPDVGLRLYLACGTMLGFLSHLVLDEFCAVDLLGSAVHPSKSVGSPLKFIGSSWGPTLLAYAILAGLGYLAHLEWTGEWTPWRERVVHTDVRPQPRP